MIESVLAVALVAVAIIVGIALFLWLRQPDTAAKVEHRLFESNSHSDCDDSLDPEFRQRLVQAIKTSPDGFDFHLFVSQTGVDLGIANQVAEEVYRSYFYLSNADGIINKKERCTLDALARLLLIPDERLQLIEKEQ